MVDATGGTTYQYDGLGRATQVAAPSGTLTYAYDLDGNRTTLGYPGAQNVTYGYSPGGRMTTVTDWATRASRYTYQPSGPVATLEYPSGLRATYAYDRAQRLTQITNAVGATTVTQHSYGLDPEGNRTTLDEYVQAITPPPIVWAESTRVNDDTGTTQQDRPSIALGPDGATYLVWDDFRAGSHADIFFAPRDPATGTWSDDLRVQGGSAQVGLGLRMTGIAPVELPCGTYGHASRRLLQYLRRVPSTIRNDRRKGYLWLLKSTIRRAERKYRSETARSCSKCRSHPQRRPTGCALPLMHRMPCIGQFRA